MNKRNPIAALSVLMLSVFLVTSCNRGQNENKAESDLKAAAKSFISFVENGDDTDSYTVAQLKALTEFRDLKEKANK